MPPDDPFGTKVFCIVGSYRIEYHIPRRYVRRRLPGIRIWIFEASTVKLSCFLYKGQIYFYQILYACCLDQPGSGALFLYKSTKVVERNCGYLREFFFCPVKTGGRIESAGKHYKSLIAPHLVLFLYSSNDVSALVDPFVDIHAKGLYILRHFRCKEFDYFRRKTLNCCFSRQHVRSRFW